MTEGWIVRATLPFPAGKGVIVCRSISEVLDAVRSSLSAWPAAKLEIERGIA